MIAVPSIIDKKKKDILNKHQAVVHCSVNWSLRERKIANCLLFKAYPNLLTHDYHVITVSELKQLLDIRTNENEAIKNAARKLLSTVVEWNVLKKYHNQKSIYQWNACTMLAAISIENNTIRYEYSNTLKQLLYNPDCYVKISLQIQNKFRTSYGLALYENCISYKNVGSTGWIDMGDFYRILGIPIGKYRVFRDLNRRVIKPAMAEINQHSDIKVDIELKIQNRNPVAVKFVITKSKLASPDKSILNSKLIRKGLSEQVAQSIVTRYPQAYLEEKLNMLENGKNVIKNPAAFLVKALQDDYKPPLLKNPIGNDNNKMQNDRKIIEEYENYLLKQVSKWIDGLGDEQRQALLIMLDKYLQDIKIDTSNMVLIDVAKKCISIGRVTSGEFLKVASDFIRDNEDLLLRNNFKLPCTDKFIEYKKNHLNVIDSK